MPIETRVNPDMIEEFTSRGCWHDITIQDLIRRNAAERPQKEAIYDGRVRVTYAELDTCTDRLALKFLELGIQTGDLVAVQLPNWVEFVFAVGALSKIGAMFCQFSAEFRSREVEFILRFSEAVGIVIPSEFKGFRYLEMIEGLRPRLPKLRHVLVVGSEVPGDAINLRDVVEGPLKTGAKARSLDVQGVGPNELMRLAFTSGTTGDPKAVLHTANTTIPALEFQNRDHGISRDGVILLFLPVGLNWGLFCVIQSLLVGAKLVMMDVFKAQAALSLIASEKVSYFATAPTSLIAMMNDPEFSRFDTTSLRIIATGGASCPIEVIKQANERLGGRLVELYGMLECGFQSWTLPTDDPEEVCGTVGRAIAEMQLKIVDDAGRALPVGETGEIATYGPTVTVGYFRNPQANEASFTADGWFLSGDLGVFDERGLLRIVGRKKDMIIRGGANIYPREIEEILFTLPKILDVAVIGIPDPHLGEKMCACVVPRPGETVTLEEIVSFLRDQIAKYKLPEVVQIVDELPHTPTGKVQKNVLLEQIMGQLTSHRNRG